MWPLMGAVLSPPHQFVVAWRQPALELLATSPPERATPSSNFGLRAVFCGCGHVAHPRVGNSVATFPARDAEASEMPL